MSQLGVLIRLLINGILSGNRIDFSFPPHEETPFNGKHQIAKETHRNK